MSNDLLDAFINSMQRNADEAIKSFVKREIRSTSAKALDSVADILTDRETYAPAKFTDEDIREIVEFNIENLYDVIDRLEVFCYELEDD